MPVAGLVIAEKLSLRILYAHHDRVSCKFGLFDQLQYPYRLCRVRAQVGRSPVY